MNLRRSDQHICVRPFEQTDAELFYAAVRESLDSLCRWMPWCTPGYSLEDAQKWVAHCHHARRARTEFALGIFSEPEGRLLGGTGINRIDRVYGIGNIGYWVGTPHTGRGIARAAARMAADIGFCELGLTRLEIVVLADNPASQRVAAAAGANLECVARNRLRFNGEARDALVYSLVPADIGIDG